MFSELIKTLRAEKNLSQSQLAKEVGVSTGNVGDWEIGRSKPGYLALAALSRYFVISADFLLELTGERNYGKKERSVCDGHALSETESDLIAMYRFVDDADKKTIFDITTLKYEQATGEKGSIYLTYADTDEQQKNNSDERQKFHDEIA